MDDDDKPDEVIEEKPEAVTEEKPIEAEATSAESDDAKWAGIRKEVQKVGSRLEKLEARLFPVPPPMPEPHPLSSGEKPPTPARQPPKPKPNRLISRASRKPRQL